MAARAVGKADTSFTVERREIDRRERAARRTAAADGATARRARPSSTAWAPPAAEEKPTTLTREQRKRAAAAEKLRADDRLLADTVPAAALARGHHRVQVVPGPTIVTKDGEKVTTAKVIVNRGGTAVERWILGDRTGQFDLPQQYAIRFVQNLWSRASGDLRAVDLAEPRVDAPLGWSQHEALDELQRIKGALPSRYWDVFENVCRFDEEAGVAGSKLASNSRSAIDAAKTTVAFIASAIAMWKGF